MDPSPHKSDFVSVNGIRLHYLDWGGNSPVLLFLAGLGCNAHIYDRFAPRFSEHFHAFALTRRGHGESDYPDTGYDIDTLTEDIHQFMDQLHIDQAILAGHSLAGVELSHFNALYPGRLLKLVFLDAAYDRSSAECKEMQEKNPMNHIEIPGEDADYHTPEELSAHLRWVYPSFAAIWSEMMDEHHRHEVKVNPDGNVVYKMSDEISKQLNGMVSSYVPEDSKIKVPTLSFFAIKEKTYAVSPNYMTSEQQAQMVDFFENVQQPWNWHCIEKFRRDVPHAKIVIIPNGHHYCFIQQADLVYDEMRSFLSAP